MISEEKILSVGELTRHIKHLLLGDPLLTDLWVRGEISNFTHHSSGHMYFTLKDEVAAVRCVMFRGDNRALAFAPEDGLKVVARGDLSVYEKAGNYQLYVRELVAHGQGALFLAFEQLKRRLEAEGLFAPGLKRALPALPRKIGIVTSPTGAAIQDIIRVSRRRFPGIGLTLVPVRVQGQGAAEEIARGIDLLHRVPGIDLIIVGRGGGSLEDLWAFNEEIVARAIARARIPIISAVGHETDFTIADFVADARAATPSAAAELAVPDRRVLDRELVSLVTRLRRGLRKSWQEEARRLARLQGSRVFVRPLDFLLQRRQRLDELGRRLERGMKSRLLEIGSQQAQLAARLDALSPLAILGRGYSICRTVPGGRIVRSSSQVRSDDQVEIVLNDGALACRVEGIEARRPTHLGYGGE